MTVLSPIQAARIAVAAYETRTLPLFAKQTRQENPFGAKDAFEVSADFVFSGVTGPWLFESRTGFGFVGKGIGAHQGEVLLAFRGTDTWRDLFTDGNFGVQKGPRGTQVHAGFNNTFKSLEPQLRSLLKGTNPSRVHCVGHSLGGALASLAMDWCVGNGVGKPLLYTFGSPRVGVADFTTSLTHTVDATSIYRVHHTADPVSMMPIFPFFHLPQPGMACSIRWAGGRISRDAHKMAGGNRTYLDSVDGQTWATLRKANEMPVTVTDVEQWLASPDTSSAQSLSGKSLHYINLALEYIVNASKQTVGMSLQASAGTISLAVCSGLTLLDRLAWLLTQAAQMNLALGRKIDLLLRKMLLFVGRQYVKDVQLTISFVRWVLSLLVGAVNCAAGLALDAVHQLTK